MTLVVMDLFRLQHVPVQQLLELDQRSRFMTADISQIIWAAAANGQRLGVLEFLHVYFVIRGIAVILNPEGNRFEQLVVFDQLYVTNGVDLFPPTNHFIGSIGIYILNKVR